MMPLFPRSTRDLKLEEPAAFRRLSRSLVETAVLAGVVIRLYRALALANSTGGWMFWAFAGTIGILIYFALLTAHLGNYPVRRWVWRAPAFALVAVIAEMATSLLLIAMGREPTGSVRAEWSDWPGMAANALLERGVAVCAYAALLAVAVWTVRRVARGRRRD